MKIKISRKHLSVGVTAFGVIAASILFYQLINQFPAFSSFIGQITSTLSPIIMGFVLAYVLKPVLEFFEEKCFIPLFSRVKRIKKPKRIARGVSVFVTIVSALAAISALLAFVIPQVVESLIAMFARVPEYITIIERFSTDLLQSNPELQMFVEEQFSSIETQMLGYIKDLTPVLTSFASDMALGALGVLTSLLNFLIGFLISAYVMFSKEAFASQTKRVIYAVFPHKFASNLIKTAKITDKTFGGFITGKLIDSAIIGILCFIFCSIVNMPYATLASVLIGVSNIIPFFGPFIGAVPSAFIIMLESPMMSLVFVIFIVVLQQIDGNIIGPKILGESTGLSAFWVIFSILIGGGLFGVLGMFIGAPTFAVLYLLFKTFINGRLEKKGLPTDFDSYANGSEPSLPENDDGEIHIFED